MDMQDNSFQPNTQPFGAAPAQPYGQPAAPTGQPVPPAQPMGQPYGQPAVPPKKSKTGLIIGIVVALIVIIAVVVVLIVVLGKKDDKPSTDTNTSNDTSQQDKGNSKSNEQNAKSSYEISYDGKTFTYTTGYADTVKSMFNAGLVLHYKDSAYKEYTITDVDSYLATPLTKDGFAVVYVNDDRGIKIIDLQGYDAHAENPKTYADLKDNTLSFSLSATGQTTIDGKAVTIGTTTHDEVVQLFGTPTSDQTKEDSQFDFYTTRYGNYGELHFKMTFKNTNDVLDGITIDAR